MGSKPRKLSAVLRDNVTIRVYYDRYFSASLRKNGLGLKSSGKME